MIKLMNPLNPLFNQYCRNNGMVPVHQGDIYGGITGVIIGWKPTANSLVYMGYNGEHDRPYSLNKGQVELDRSFTPYF